MDLAKTLSLGQSKKRCNQIVNWIGSDKKRFAELMNCFFEAEEKIRRFAAWPMCYCAIANPALIKPWLNRLISVLDEKNGHDALIRNIVRLLQFVEIPKSLEGRIMNHCFQYIQSPNRAPAIKAFSLTILGNLSKKYPEIHSELKLIIEERWPMEKPAFHSRARKIMSEIKQ
jgi:hypothetical protein